MATKAHKIDERKREIKDEWWARCRPVQVTICYDRMKVTQALATADCQWQVDIACPIWLHSRLPF